MQCVHRYGTCVHRSYKRTRVFSNSYSTLLCWAAMYTRLLSRMYCSLSVTTLIERNTRWAKSNIVVGCRTNPIVTKATWSNLTAVGLHRCLGNGRVGCLFITKEFNNKGLGSLGGCLVRDVICYKGHSREPSHVIRMDCVDFASS